MTSMEMYEYAKEQVAAYIVDHPDPSDAAPDVLWTGGMLEIRRAVVWCGVRLFMVTYNTSTEETVIDEYRKHVL